MTARKKWRIVYPGSDLDCDAFPSEKATYRHVDSLRTQWAAGDPTGSLTVQVDNGLGFGWETHEFIDFAEEA